MLHDGKIWVATGEKPIYLLPKMANRHGLIAGATGTGKTVSLKVLAEGFSDLGVPVFLSDIKGDLSGMVRCGAGSDKLTQRLASCGVESFTYTPYPTIFWDVYGEQGHPVRCTVKEMGPLLLSRVLGLNDTQTGVLNILFRVADDEGMQLLDIKDLKAMLAYVGENAKAYTLNYGNVSSASIGAIQRAIGVLEDQGGNLFFGEPALDIGNWMQRDDQGRGVINILAADRLFNNPTMYSSFLLWMLTELYDLLPEVGDMEKPRMVFFFDEAHLLFNNCPRNLLEKIEQVVRLIRSKGVGVYFITQSPADIPMSVLGQLGNRIQHALRAYTPLDQKAVRIAAQTFRTNPRFNTEEAITALKTGEALISFLDEHGAPGVVDRATVLPPQSSMNAITAEERSEVIEASPYFGVYDQVSDRESAYEMLVSSFKQEGVKVMQPTMDPQNVQVQSNPQQPNIARPAGFMVFDPTTGQYVQKEIPTMTPLQQPVMQQPVVQQPVPTIQVQQPVAQQPVMQQPVMQQPVMQPMVQQMPVMVYDPTSGQYVQQMMTMQLDPATGNWVPCQQQTAQPISAAEAEKQRKAAEKAARDAEAQARRARTDELREERAERARRNDSVLGRVKNTAISSGTRTVVNKLVNGVFKKLGFK